MLFVVVLVVYCCGPAAVVVATWSSALYPDIRGTSAEQCQATIPPDQLLYVCDPDRVLNKSQTTWLNSMLHELSLSTPCHCQRRSQCAVSTDSEALHGFVVSIAVVQNLQMTMHSPSEQQLTDRAESFCRALEGKWALGDCGNSLIIFVWQHYKKMIIWPARLAERYVTAEERKAMLASVNGLAQTDDWYSALSEVIGEIRRELNGEPETRVDTGTLSLIVSVGVAVVLTMVITSQDQSALHPLAESLDPEESEVEFISHKFASVHFGVVGISKEMTGVSQEGSTRSGTRSCDGLPPYVAPSPAARSFRPEIIHPSSPTPPLYEWEATV